MPRSTLLLLGSPRIEYAGEPVEVDTRKAIALLAYLAVTHERQSRDALATLLWPDYDQTRARAALRRTLSVLNKALAGDWLDIDRENIGLQRNSSLWVDVDHFHNQLAECRTHGHPEADVCQACLPLLTEAVTLYRDDFMAGFTLRDSPQFDDWQFLQAESLRRELAGALERLVRAYAAQGEWEPAIAYARRWLSLDPLHEPAHRALMSLFAWAGQRATALRQYRECMRALEEELGVAPAEETTQLYQAIKDNQVLPPAPALAPTVSGDRIDDRVPAATTSAVSPSSPPSVAPRPKFAPPLVGRSAEWMTLLEAYAIAKDGGHIVILEGEAGIGKTRLAEEFLTHIRAQGAAMVAARCYAGETNLAYGPFVEGLSAALAQAQHAGQLEQVPAQWLSEAARLLPELGHLFPGLPPAPPLDTPGAQSRFFEGISQVLLAVCGNMPPGVLFFDDLHWADTASLDLLTYLVRRLHGRPLCILATWRSEQVLAGHRLRELVADAQRAGTATVLRLPRLDQSAVEEWVESVAGDDAALSSRLGQRLYAETEGLPLFLGEYLTAIVQGTLPTEDAGWSLPGGVRDLLLGRLQAISETDRQVLNTAAVIGRSFDFDTLREASGRSEEETVTALEELIGQGLVEEVRAGVGAPPSGHPAMPLPTYDFGHEKLRALVYDQISLARRRLLHRRVAEVLVSRTHARHDSAGGFETRPYSLIAHHYQLAGQAVEAAEYFKLAGEHARALYANAEALAHFHTALALGHPDASALHEAIGDLHTLGGEYGAALASYEAAATLCDDPYTLATVEHKLGIVYQRRGEWELAERHLQAALAGLGENGPAAQRARLYADWSLVAHHRGQIDQALELAHQALELADVAGDTRALAEAHNRLGILATSQGDLAQARYHLQQSLELAETLHDPSARAAALNNLALAHAAGGETEQALKLAEAALALCVAQGDRHREAALHNNLADLLHAAGQHETAMAHLKQAVAIYADIGVEAGAVQPAIWKLTEW